MTANGRASMKEQTGPQVAAIPWLTSGELSHQEGRTSQTLTAAKVRQMRRDPTISLARELSMAPILSSEWSVEAEEEAPEGAKEFIQQELLPLRIHVVKTGLSGWIDWGWQPYEKIFGDAKDGRIGLKKLKPLLQDFTTILVDNKTGAYAGLKQSIVGTPVILGVPESLLLSFDVEGTDWRGQSIMEKAELTYDAWLKIESAANRYDQKVAGSHWVVHYPRGTSKVNGVDTDNFTVAKQLLNTLEASGGIAVPSLADEVIANLNIQAKFPKAWEIELLSDTGNARANFIDRQKYLDARLVRAFGLPERAILEGQFGTKAEAEAHADLAIANMDLRHQKLVQDINWHLVNQLLRFNFGPDAEGSVYLSPSPIADLAIQFLRQLFLAMVGNPEGFATFVSGVDLESLFDRLNVPVRPDANLDAAGYNSPLIPTGPRVGAGEIEDVVRFTA
jgi:hypothetical protein